MSVDTFANCFANVIGSNVDSVIDDLNKLGPDGIRSVANWWSNLDDKSRQLVGVVAPIFTATLSAILTKVFNQATAELLIAMLGGFVAGASWGLLMRGYVDCIGQL